MAQQENLSGPEQRLFRRFRVSITMRFILISGENRRLCSRFYSTALWDLGLRGASLTTPKLTLDGIHFFYNSIPTVRNRVLMQIKLPGKYGTITVLGQAVHSRPIEGQRGKGYLVGIHFFQMSEPHGVRLRTFLNDVGENPSSRKADP